MTGRQKAKTDQLQKSGSGRQYKGKTAKTGFGDGQNCDRKTQQVIHSLRSLASSALTKKRSAEASVFNVSADRTIFWKPCANLWITCGNRFCLWTDQAGGSLFSSSASDVTGRSLSRKGSSSDNIVSASSSGSSESAPDPSCSSAASVFSASSAEGKETFR